MKFLKLLTLSLHTCGYSTDVALNVKQKDVPLLMKDCAALLLHFVLTMPSTLYRGECVHAADI